MVPENDEPMTRMRIAESGGGIGKTTSNEGENRESAGTGYYLQSNWGITSGVLCVTVYLNNACKNVGSNI